MHAGAAIYSICAFRLLDFLDVNWCSSCLSAWIDSRTTHDERMSDLPSSSAEWFLAWQCSNLRNLKAACALAFSASAVSRPWI